ncbi:MAG: tetratricopeptide repeat protein [Woeseiaceae bacterium]
MSHSLDQLVWAAGESARAGRWQEAERLWREVHKLEPRHPQALFSLGVHAMQRGQLGDAYDFLKAGRQASPQDLLILMALAVVSQKRGDAKGEREAIEAALAVDAYYLPAILARAGWIERHGVPTAAVDTYKAALQVAAPETHWPAELRPQLEHARDVVGRHSAALSAHLNDALSSRLAGLPGDIAARWREAASIMAGRSQPYNVDCNHLHVPRLPAVPFFDRVEFPWVDALEAKTDVIRDELTAALETDKDRSVPYVARRPGEPVNQWKDLNHSTRWGAFHLWVNGKPVEENLARCPETAKALAEVPMAEIEGLCRT